MLNNDILFVRKGEADHGFAHIFMKRQERKRLYRKQMGVLLLNLIFILEKYCEMEVKS